MVLATFRAHFSEFADAARFPDAMLQMWATVGESRISVDRFTTLYDHAMELFVAHNLKLVAGGEAAAGGAVTSKTVGSVSISYDTAETMLPSAGHWNQTVYGRQFVQLARMIGAGCVQL